MKPVLPGICVLDHSIRGLGVAMSVFSLQVWTCRAGIFRNCQLSELEQLLARHLAEPTSSWSVGEFGVLAEFHHAGRAGVSIGPDTATTEGGGIRLQPRDDIRVLAYETPSPNPRLWNHGIAFCLPEDVATMDRRAGITELGPDGCAIFPEARGHLLFDLGLGRRCVNFCVRTSDAALIDLLRGARGRSVLEDHALSAAIVAAGPVRVVESRLARVEISNPIPPPGGVSPEGPHTHLMPELIRRKRVHDANIPVPAGFLPCLTLYPAHPARDAEGRERKFDAAMHAAYQKLLAQYGDPDYVAAKSGAQTPARSRKENLGRLIAARQRAIARN